MIAEGNFPHLLLFGPSGAGKKTRIACLLREVFGPGAEKVKIEQRRYAIPGKKPLELTTLVSSVFLFWFFFSPSSLCFV